MKSFYCWSYFYIGNNLFFFPWAEDQASDKGLTVRLPSPIQLASLGRKVSGSLCMAWTCKFPQPMCFHSLKVLNALLFQAQKDPCVAGRKLSTSRMPQDRVQKTGQRSKRALQNKCTRGQSFHAPFNPSEQRTGQWFGQLLGWLLMETISKAAQCVWRSHKAWKETWRDS